MYWHPNHLRNFLEPDFLQVKNEQTMWHFIEHDVGKYLFRDEKLTFDDGTIDLELLQKFNDDKYAEPAGGRLIIGPMRILQKRVKKIPCLRAG